MTDDDKVLCGLLAALATHPEAVVRHSVANAKDRIEAQAAEIERLREEIMQIEVDAMEHYNDWVEHGCEPVEAIHFAFDLGQYTRAALEAKP